MTKTKKHPALGQTLTDQPAIYVGTYKKYNEGSLRGAWISMNEVSDMDDFHALCADLHKDEEDPEYMFQDFQSIPRRYISESHLSEDYFEYRDKVNSMDSDQAEAYDLFIAGGHEDDDFEEAYQGKYKDEEDFAVHIVEECYNLEEMMGDLSYYFDYEKYATDLFINDYWIEDGHVFRRILGNTKNLPAGSK